METDRDIPAGGKKAGAMPGCPIMPGVMPLAALATGSLTAQNGPGGGARPAFGPPPHRGARHGD